jgi:hypothetical protein
MGVSVIFIGKFCHFINKKIVEILEIFIFLSVNLTKFVFFNWKIFLHIFLIKEKPLGVSDEKWNIFVIICFIIFIFLIAFGWSTSWEIHMDLGEVLIK